MLAPRLFLKLRPYLSLLYKNSQQDATCLIGLNEVSKDPTHLAAVQFDLIPGLTVDRTQVIIINLHIDIVIINRQLAPGRAVAVIPQNDDAITLINPDGLPVIAAGQIRRHHSRPAVRGLSGLQDFHLGPLVQIRYLGRTGRAAGPDDNLVARDGSHPAVISRLDFSGWGRFSGSTGAGLGCGPRRRFSSRRRLRRRIGCRRSGAAFGVQIIA